MILNGFERGLPSRSGLYVFQDFEGGITTTVLLVYRRNGEFFVEHVTEAREKLEAFAKRVSVVAHRAILIRD